MKIGIRHVRYFKAVAEELHYGRAAKSLNIAQPALSRSIKHLETQIGVQLLERNNRRVSLTNAGAIFLAGCQNLIDTMEGMVAQTRKASVGEAGDLMIGYTDFAISGLMPEILRDFRKLYADITIEPVHGFTSTQLYNLEQGKLDVGFITGPFKRAGYQSVTIQQDPFVAVFYENHPLAQKESVLMSELATEAFILGSPVGWEYYHDHLFRICRSAGFNPNVVQTAFNIEGIFGLVACEMGITLQLACVNNNLRKGLVVVPIRGIKETVPTMAVWKEGVGASTRQTFGQFLMDRISS